MSSPGKLELVGEREFAPGSDSYKVYMASEAYLGYLTGPRDAAAMRKAFFGMARGLGYKGNEDESAYGDERSERLVREALGLKE